MGSEMCIRDRRCFGPDDDEANVIGVAKIDDRAMVAGVKINQLCLFSDPRIAWRCKQFAARWGLRQLPGQRMFTPT